MNIQIEVEDGHVLVSKYVHLSPRLFIQRQGSNRENRKYRILDDMYSVGIMMWEVWTGERLHDTELLPIMNAETNTNVCEEVGQFLKELKPARAPHFQVDYDILTETWWHVMAMCLDASEDMLAKNWLQAWEGHSGYPPLTIVNQHF